MVNTNKPPLNIKENHTLLGIFETESMAVEVLVSDLLNQIDSYFIPADSPLRKELKSLGTFSGFQNLLSKNKKTFDSFISDNRLFFGGYNIQEIELNEPQDKCLMDIAF